MVANSLQSNVILNELREFEMKDKTEEQLEEAKKKELETFEVPEPAKHCLVFTYTTWVLGYLFLVRGVSSHIQYLTSPLTLPTRHALPGIRTRDFSAQNPRPLTGAHSSLLGRAAFTTIRWDPRWAQDARSNGRPQSWRNATQSERLADSSDGSPWSRGDFLFPPSPADPRRSRNPTIPKCQ